MQRKAESKTKAGKAKRTQKGKGKQGEALENKGTHEGVTGGKYGNMESMGKPCKV